MEGGSSAGEVRKLHVVYFLSRNGEMEQPHLIRVCHRPHREGVRLRDVKRWLSELRGKGMPDAFAWSYKRRYRTGYVWQDLADDDLITPVSDNEYVLKGSLTTTAGAAPTVSSSSSSTVFSSPSAATSAGAVHVISPLADSSRTDPKAADPFPRGNPPGDPKTPRRPPETAPAENPNRHDEVSPKPPSPVEEKVDERAVVKERRENSVPPPHHSDASTQVTTGRAAAVLSVDIPRRADAAAAGSPLPVSNGSSCEIEAEAQPEEEGGEEEKKGARAHDSCYSLLPGRRRGHSWCGGGNGGRASHAFRNLLGCVDDSALQPVEPVRRGQPGGGKVDPLLSGGSHRDAAGGGASRESRGGGGSCSRTAAGEAAGEQKTATVHGEVYKPAAEPSCSQCGKPFKPERFHAHMRSCRALRSHRKKMSTEKLPKELESHTAMLSEEASSLFLLSH